MFNACRLFFVICFAAWLAHPSIAQQSAVIARAGTVPLEQHATWLAVPGLQQFFIVTEKALIYLNRHTLEIAPVLDGADFKSVKKLYDECSFQWSVDGQGRKVRLHADRHPSDECIALASALQPRPLAQDWQLIVDPDEPPAPEATPKISAGQSVVPLTGERMGSLTLEKGVAVVRGGGREVKLPLDPSAMGRFAHHVDSGDGDRVLPDFAEFDPASELFIYDRGFSPEKQGWWNVTLFKPNWQIVQEFYLFSDGKIVAREGTRIVYRDSAVLERLLVYSGTKLGAASASSTGAGEARLLDDRMAANGQAKGARSIDTADPRILAAAAPAWRRELPRLTVNTGYAAPAKCIALTPDHDFALIWHTDDIFRYWSLKSPIGPRLLRSFAVPNRETAYQEEIRAFSLSPNGQFAAVSRGGDVGYVTLIDLDLGEELFHKAPGTNDLIFSASGDFTTFSWAEGSDTSEAIEVNTLSTPEGISKNKVQIDRASYDALKRDRGLRKCAPVQQAKDIYSIEPVELLDNKNSVPADWTFDFGATKLVQTRDGLTLSVQGKTPNPLGESVPDAGAIASAASGEKLLVGRQSGGLFGLDLQKIQWRPIAGLTGAVAPSGLAGAPGASDSSGEAMASRVFAVDKSGTLYFVNAGTEAAAGLKLPLFGNPEGLLLSPGGDRAATFLPALGVGYEVDLTSLTGHFIFPADKWERYGLWHYGFYGRDLVAGAPAAMLMGGNSYRLTASVTSPRRDRLIAAIAEPAAGPGIGVQVGVWRYGSSEQTPATVGEQACLADMCNLSSVVTALSVHPEMPWTTAGHSTGALEMFNFESGARMWAQPNAHELAILTTAPAAGGRLLASLDAAGVVNFWNAADGEAVASFVSLSDGDWILSTPQGIFEGSSGVGNKLHVAWGRKVFSFAGIVEKFRRPDLLREALSPQIQPYKEAVKTLNLAELLEKQPANSSDAHPARGSEPAPAELSEKDGRNKAGSADEALNALTPEQREKLRAGFIRFGIVVGEHGTDNWQAATERLQSVLHSDRSKITGILSENERRFLIALAELPDPPETEATLGLDDRQRARISFELEKQGFVGYRGQSLQAFSPEDRVRILRAQGNAKEEGTGFLTRAEVSRLTEGPPIMSDRRYPNSPAGSFGDWALYVTQLPSDGGDSDTVCLISTPAVTVSPLRPIRPIFAMLARKPFFDLEIILDQTRLLPNGAKLAVAIEPPPAASRAFRGERIEDQATEAALIDRVWPEISQLAAVQLHYESDEERNAFVQAMQNGKTLNLEGQGFDGRLAATYSLQGFLPAYQAMQKHCGGGGR